MKPLILAGMTCRYFNSYEECQKAAERVHGYCGPKRQALATFINRLSTRVQV
jgi:hypothetical protein